MAKTLRSQCRGSRFGPWSGRPCMLQLRSSTAKYMHKYFLRKPTKVLTAQNTRCPSHSTHFTLLRRPTPSMVSICGYTAARPSSTVCRDATLLGLFTPGKLADTASQGFISGGLAVHTYQRTSGYRRPSPILLRLHICYPCTLGEKLRYQIQR